MKGIMPVFEGVGGDFLIVLPPNSADPSMVQTGPGRRF
jgi:hypothetical protein